MCPLTNHVKLKAKILLSTEYGIFDSISRTDAVKNCHANCIIIHQQFGKLGIQNVAKYDASYKENDVATQSVSF